MSSSSPIHLDPYDVDERLAQLGLTREPFVTPPTNISQHIYHVLRTTLQPSPDWLHGPKAIVRFVMDSRLQAGRERMR